MKAIRVHLVSAATPPFVYIETSDGAAINIDPRSNEAMSN